MFSEITTSMLERMQALVEIDARDRIDGTGRLKRLRQVPAVTGQFIALMAASAPDGRMIEIGTSAGYSTLWLSLACRATGRIITTFELLEEKARLARETFSQAGVEDVVNFVHGDALEHIGDLKEIAFCFLDAEKDMYADCYEAVVPHLVPGGLLIADNAINHAPTLQPMIDRALADERVDALVVPIGNGELVCRRK